MKIEIVPPLVTGILAETLEVAYFVGSRTATCFLEKIGFKHNPILGVYMEHQFASNGPRLPFKTIIVIYQQKKFGISVSARMEGFCFNIITGKVVRLFKSRTINLKRIDPHGIAYIDHSKQDGRRFVGRGVIKFRQRTGSKYQSARGAFIIPVKDKSGATQLNRVDVTWKRLSDEGLKAILDRWSLRSNPSVDGIIDRIIKHCD